MDGEPHAGEGITITVTSRAEDQPRPGRAVVRWPAAHVAHVQTEDYMGGPLVDEALTTVNRVLEGLPAGTRRELFMDHSGVTGMSLAIVMVSLRWFVGVPRPKTVHVRLAGLPAALRVWMWLLYPLLMWSCEYHATAAGFEARLRSESG